MLMELHLTPRLNPSQTGQYLIYLPRRDGRLSWSRWLARGFNCPRAVTHPSTNWAQCQWTTLMEANTLITTPHCHPIRHRATLTNQCLSRFRVRRERDKSGHTLLASWAVTPARCHVVTSSQDLGRNHCGTITLHTVQTCIQRPAKFI